MPRLAAILIGLLVLVLAAPAPAATPKAGRFKGTTGQKRAFSFSVSSSRRAAGSFSFALTVSCGGARQRRPFTITGTVPVANGRFAVRLLQARGGSLAFGGRFTSATRAHGTVRYSRGNCRSGLVRWTAARV